MSILIWN